MVWFICGTNTFLAKCPKFTRFAGLRGFFLRIQGGGSSPTHLPANLVWAVHGGGGGGLTGTVWGLFWGSLKTCAEKQETKTAFQSYPVGRPTWGKKHTQSGRVAIYDQIARNHTPITITLIKSNQMKTVKK